MENQQELNTSEQNEISALKAKVAQLEEKLDDALMIIADTYRYGKLKNLLAAGKWDEADLETTRVMIEITGRPNMDKIKPDDIQKFPCNAIMLVDNIWRKYSNDRFGFSVQLKIYQSNFNIRHLSEHFIKCFKLVFIRSTDLKFKLK